MKFTDIFQKYFLHIKIKTNQVYNRLIISHINSQVHHGKNWDKTFVQQWIQNGCYWWITAAILNPLLNKSFIPVPSIINLIVLASAIYYKQILLFLEHHSIKQLNQLLLSFLNYLFCLLLLVYLISIYLLPLTYSVDLS